MTLEDIDQQELPTWLGEITSLQVLLIFWYQKLEAPLEKMKHLASLYFVRVMALQKHVNSTTVVRRTNLSPGVAYHEMARTEWLAKHVTPHLPSEVGCELLR